MGTRRPRRRVRTFSVLGSERDLHSGGGVTAATSLDCPSYWFSGETTVILGGWPAVGSLGRAETIASWSVFIDSFAASHSDGGYLIVGCRRYFGGLHSRRSGSRADIWFNDRQLDGFGLFVRADQHSDYFHRVPAGAISLPAPFKRCETLYTWPLRPEQLRVGDPQVVRIRLDADVRWDIDYVGIQLGVLPADHRVFMSHASEDKPTARLLADGLRSRGVGVWLDEAEMRVGDSLLARISEAIGSVEYVVALLSDASVTSPWVQKELSIAMHDEIAGSRVKVLPVRISGVQMPTFLLDKLYIDCQSVEAVPGVVEQLVTRVTT